MKKQITRKIIDTKQDDRDSPAAMSPNLMTFAVAAISLASFPGASSQCFLPDGQPADGNGFNDFEPCNGRNTTWQQCCFPGDMCTGNGICMHSEGTVTDTFSYRGGCVNADWSGCPHACLTGEFYLYFV